MAKFIRYALAGCFFAASAGCLAIWGSSLGDNSILASVRITADKTLCVELQRGILAAMALPHSPLTPIASSEARRGETYFSYLPRLVERHGAFGSVGPISFLPLWYPALVFAFAGVGVLRFRWRFSMRSALIAVSVIAALLGMVVAL